MRRYLPSLMLAAVLWPSLVTTSMAQSEPDRFNALANLPFEQNRPTAETAQTLKDELLFQQATQAYLWAMPLVNTLGMKFGSEQVFGAGYNIHRSGRSGSTPGRWSRHRTRT
ncbi:MAG: hypothetical protein R3D05_18250 [Dongiaceae bacterium]